MVEYIERTEELILAMNAGARAIENTKRYHGTSYAKKDVFSRALKKISFLRAAEVLREASEAEAVWIAQMAHGRWLPFCSEIAGNIQYCSCCGIGCNWRPNFCPNCGALMEQNGELRDAAAKEVEE